MENNKRWILVSLLALLIVFFVMQTGEGKEFKGVKLNEGLDDLTRQLTKDLPAGSPVTIVVADFHNLDGEITGLGRYIAEEMITKLFVLGKLRVIERGQLEKALEELKFNQTDLFDPALAKKLGKFLGADAIMAGTITDLDSIVRINARLFSTEQREIMAAGTTTIIRDEEVERLLKIRLQSRSYYSSKPEDREREVPEVQDDSKDVNMPALAFESDLLRVTVKGLRRSGSRLILEVWYENMTEETMRLVSSDWGRAYATSHRGTYIISETGEKWLFEDDTQVGNHYGGTELVPRQRLINEITFTHEGRGDGSVFTYVGKYSARWRNNPRKPYQHESLEVLIRDIRIGNYDERGRPGI